MAWYRLAGREFFFSCPVPELALFETKIARDRRSSENGVVPLTLVSQTTGWVAGRSRSVEVWSASPEGFLVRVADGSDFYISGDGCLIQPISRTKLPATLDEIDRQIAAGPVIVLALALQGVWCLHASAVMFQGTAIVFLGESGQGKSTLSAYLAQNPAWRLVADDILPVRISKDNIELLPYFPQLKLPVDAQPGIGLPEHLPFTIVCVLEQEDGLTAPALEALTTALGSQSLLQHTAGTRMYHATLLAEHMDACVQAAGHLSFYRLSYPPRAEVLPEIREMLLPLC